MNKPLYSLWKADTICEAKFLETKNTFQRDSCHSLIVYLNK